MQGRLEPRALQTGSDFNHFEVFLARTAFRTGPVHRNILPTRPRRNIFFGRSGCLVVDPAANQAHPGFHLVGVRSCEGAVRRLRAAVQGAAERQGKMRIVQRRVYLFSRRVQRIAPRFAFLVARSTNPLHIRTSTHARSPATSRDDLCRQRSNRRRGPPGRRDGCLEYGLSRGYGRDRSDRPGHDGRRRLHGDRSRLCR